MNVSLQAASLVAVQRGLREAPEMARRELLAAMTEAVGLLQSDVQNTFPADTGSTRASIGADAYLQELGVLGVVGSPQPLVSWIELGTRPHPISLEGQRAVAEWAQRKLGLGEAEAEGLAIGYARKVKARGTPPKPIMAQSLARNLPAIARMFDDAAGRIAVQMLGGAA